MAGIPSEQQTVILNASPQNSPGEVKSPTAAGKVFRLFKDELTVRFLPWWWLLELMCIFTDVVSGDDEEKSKSMDGKPSPGNRSGRKKTLSIIIIIIIIIITISYKKLC